MVDSGGKISQYIYDHMDKTDDNRIATAEEVLQTLTKILRMELYETTEEVNPVTGEVVELKNSPKLSDVNRAGAELLKRYPLAAKSKKMELEIEKLQSQIGGNEQQDDKIAEYINMVKGVMRDGD